MSKLPHTVGRSVSKESVGGAAPGYAADEELVRRISSSTGLSAAEAHRVIGDVLAFYSECVEDYVRRRHSELQLRGVRNAGCFTQIAAELRRRPVASPELTERQLRRIVYG